MAQMANPFFSRKFTFEFIDLYKSLRALWDVNSEEYNCKSTKNEAYEKMLEKYKEIEPAADRKMVTAKINSLRTSYRREHRKVMKIRKVSGSAEPAYRPTLYYYKKLNFLDNITSNRALYKLDDLGSDDMISEDDSTYEQMDLFEASEDPPKPISILPNPPEKQPTPTGVKIKTENETPPKIPPPANEFINPYCEDQHDTYGKNVASKLRNLPREQRIYLEKIINEAIFEAELGNLSRNSKVQV